MTTGVSPDAAAALLASVASGQRAAAGFVSVPWVSEQLHELLGRQPFPGTLNVKVRDPHSLAAWRRLATSGAGLAMPAGEPGYCDSSYFPALLNDVVPCGIVRPLVPGYPADVVELVAGENLRERLGLRDGDEVRIEWAPAYHGLPTQCVPAHTERRDRRVSPARPPCDHAEEGRRHSDASRGPGAPPPPPNDGGRRGPS